MSTGHHHARPNMLAHTRELNRMLKTGDAPVLMRRWSKLDLDHDMAYLAGYNVEGTTRYADRDFVRALYDPAYAEQIIGKPIITGLTPDDTLECVLWHEAIEKVLLDADNPIDDYAAAHEFATAGEHDKVRQKGGTPARYERGLKAIIAWCEAKPLKSVPRDLACAPMLDDGDASTARILKALRKLDVDDAFKAAKESVDYGKSSGDDQCQRCARWLSADRTALSPCQKVEGLVRPDRWCDEFKGAHTLDHMAHANWRQRARHARLHGKIQHSARAPGRGGLPAMGQ